MKRINAILWFFVAFPICTNGGRYNIENLHIAAVEKRTILVKRGSALQTQNSFTNVVVDYYIKKEELTNSVQNIISIINNKYRIGVKKEVKKWEDWYDYNYANKCWVFLDRINRPVFMLCFFDKKQCRFRKSSFWGVCGVDDLSVGGELPGLGMYQIIDNDKWNGTFESDELEKLLITEK